MVWETITTSHNKTQQHVFNWRQMVQMNQKKSTKKVQLNVLVFIFYAQEYFFKIINSLSHFTRVKSFNVLFKLHHTQNYKSAHM